MKSLSPRTLLTMAIFMSLAACVSISSNQEGSRMSVAETKQALLGEWVSLAPEIRSSATKSADGSLRPFYLSRLFKYRGQCCLFPTAAIKSEAMSSGAIFSASSAE